MATNTTIQGFAPQIEPMAEEAYGEAQNIFQKRMGEGYTAPKTPLFTPFSQPELDAQQRTLEIARGPGAGQAIDDASGYARQGVSGVGSLIPGLMNPYTTQVADVAKRRFAEDYKRQVMNPLATAATSSGTQRGSRYDAERLKAQERMAQGMSDIDIQMLNAAYNNASGLANQQRQRELQGAPLIGNLGLSAYQNELRSPELMSAVGETQRGQLDLARQAELAQEMAELNYPERTIQQYFNFLGLGRAPTSTSETRPDGAGVLQGGTSPRGLGGIIKEFGPTLAAIPGIIKDAPQVLAAGKSAFDTISSFFAEGGRVSGGLASLPVRRAGGGGMGPGAQYRDRVQNAYGGGINTMSPEFRSTMVGREYQDLMNAQNMKIPAAMDTNYSPGDIAAMARNIQRMPLTKETSLGQLGEIFTEYGLSALETKDAAQKRAIGAKAAAVAGARDSVDTVLDIEKGGVERDKILSDAAVKLVEDAISARDALTAAAQGGANENVIKQLTESADQAARFAQEGVKQLNARFGIELPVTLPSAEDVNAAIAGDAQTPPGIGVTPQAERTPEGRKSLTDDIKKQRTRITEEQSKLNQ